MSPISKIFDVTSLQADRVSVVSVNGCYFVSKKTSLEELNNLAKVNTWLKKNGNVKNRKGSHDFNIKVPKIIEWKNRENLLIMEYCSGVNLETELLKNDRKKVFYLDIISDILYWMKDKSFYWQDFAPRNILFNKKNNTVTLIDFESSLKIGRKIMSEKEFNIFIQNRIILELATVLFTDEQNYLCPNIWKYSLQTSIPLKNINGRRRRKYILLNYPGISRIKHKDLVQIERKIISIASPFYYKNKAFYPLIALSKIDSVDKYIKTISRLEVKEKLFWPKIIDIAINSNKKS